MSLRTCTRSTLAASLVALLAAASAAAGHPAHAMPAPDPEVGPSHAVAGARDPEPEASWREADRSAGEPRGEWPLQPRPDVAAHFDPPEQRWGSGHRGVDLIGRVGQPVRAALPGRVSFAGSVAGMRVVVVDHGPTRTTYQPVAASVGRGDEVAAGDVIGTLTWAGTHCAPAACLHWGWRRGDTYLDPLLLVGAAPRPVRLLPL